MPLPPPPLPVTHNNFPRLNHGLINREGWLTEMAKRSEPLFSGFKLAAYRVTCGWPVSGGIAIKKRTVGQCFCSTVSKGKVHEIFISPLLETVEDVAGTLLHEMAHVAAGIPAGHGGRFTKVCRQVGLVKGKPTNAMPGDALAERLLKLAEPLGKYPHTAIVPRIKEKKIKPPPIKLECDCGCKVSMTFKDAQTFALPTCGCGIPFVRPKGDDDNQEPSE